MKNRRIGLLFMTSILFFSINTWSQEKKQLTLSEAIELGVKNSKQLKINFEKIEEATAALKEAVEKRMPDASVSGAYLRYYLPNLISRVGIIIMEEGEMPNRLL